MSDTDLAVIGPLESVGSDDAPEIYDTPFGAARAWRMPLGAGQALWIAPDASPFAAIYAAKVAGAARVVELAAVVALNRLLEPGDLLLPDDLADLTQHSRYTFFAGKGYGFLSQREPFCPTLRGALLAAARARAPRSFARGVYLAAPGQPSLAPGAPWGADIAGTGVVPTSFLARELELCYAPLCIVTDEITTQPGCLSASRLRPMDVLMDALLSLPEERACVCAAAMQPYRDRGDIGPDWRTWIGDA